MGFNIYVEIWFLQILVLPNQYFIIMQEKVWLQIVLYPSLPVQKSNFVILQQKNVVAQEISSYVIKSKLLQTFSIFSVVVRSDSVKAKVNFGIRIVHFAWFIAFTKCVWGNLLQLKLNKNAMIYFDIVVGMYELHLLKYLFQSVDRCPGHSATSAEIP